MSPSFKERYPWTLSPPVANAAMEGFAGAALAVAVSQAGGIGFIGATLVKGELDKQLDTAKSLFLSGNLEVKEVGTLPLGVGFLVFITKLEDAAKVVALHRPAIVWLACAPKVEDFEIWTKAMRAASPSSKIWIQLASVDVAIQVAKICEPDVLIMQTSDAGGHGPCPGAGLTSLIPETRDALDSIGLQHIDIFAAGGVVEGRGMAAALCVGAKGVVMGTRFLASTEIVLPAIEFQHAVVESKDGGKSTARAVVFDELRGKSVWPAGYDGRAIAGPSYHDFQAGVGLEEVRSRYAVSAKEPHKGYGNERRAAIWAGTGVGLITEVKPAGDIANEVREMAKKCLEKTTRSLL